MAGGDLNQALSFAAAYADFQSHFQRFVVVATSFSRDGLHFGPQGGQDRAVAYLGRPFVLALAYDPLVRPDHAAIELRAVRPDGSHGPGFGGFLIDQSGRMFFPNDPDRPLGVLDGGRYEQDTVGNLLGRMLIEAVTPAGK